jgi:hypothetical protein
VNGFMFGYEGLDPAGEGLREALTPENWSGRVEVVSALDGRVTNDGVARYGQLEGRHLDPVGPRTFGSHG